MNKSDKIIGILFLLITIMFVIIRYLEYQSITTTIPTDYVKDFLMLATLLLTGINYYIHKNNK
ncbi:MAG: hypothetical protein Q4F05_05185 [bacterium]|nr:hypothetical protein [bacterium]